MTDVERFLAGAHLRTCSRLNARITEEVCGINKRSGRVLSCEGCPGLEGEGNMGTKPCIVADCSSPLWKGDHCYKHHPDTIEAKKANPKSYVNMQARIEKEFSIPVVVERPAPPVTVDELHVIDILQTVREKRQADLDLFMQDLDGKLRAVPTAAGKIVLAAQYL